MKVCARQLMTGDGAGVRDNVALRRLTLDSNDITEISNLGNLPLRHLSLADNSLSAVNGYRQLGPEDLELMSAFEETYEEMEIAFEALDANQDKRLTVAEFKSGLKMMDVKVSPAICDKIIAMLDKNGDGSISPNEFLGYFRRATPHSSGDSGIRELGDLVSINLAQNPVDSLAGLEGHHCLRVRRRHALPPTLPIPPDLLLSIHRDRARASLVRALRRYLPLPALLCVFLPSWL